MACRVFNCSIANSAECLFTFPFVVVFSLLLFLLFFVLIHISHPIGRNSRTFCAKLELITRIYYDVVRFVHICSSIICVLYHWMGRHNSSRAVCSFSALPETTTPSNQTFVMILYVIHMQTPCVFDYSPYFLYLRKINYRFSLVTVPLVTRYIYGILCRDIYIVNVCVCGCGYGELKQTRDVCT